MDSDTLSHTYYLFQYQHRLCKPFQPEDRRGRRSIPVCVEVLEARQRCSNGQPADSGAREGSLRLRGRVLRLERKPIHRVLAEGHRVTRERTRHHLIRDREVIEERRACSLEETVGLFLGRSEHPDLRSLEDSVSSGRCEPFSSRDCIIPASLYPGRRCGTIL